MTRTRGRAETLRRIAGPAALTAACLAAYIHHPALVAPLAAYLGPVGGEESVRLLLGGASYFASAWLAARIFDGMTAARARVQRRKPPKLLTELTSAGLFLAAAVATVMLVSGDSASGIITGSGILVAVVGFALRNVIADVFSGVALGLEAPYRIGDWVRIENLATGRIVEMGWRTTRLHTADQTYMIVPNAQLARERLTNYSAPQRHYRAQLELTLDHDVPVADAKAVIGAAAAAAEHILDVPPPDVLAVSHDAVGVRYVVRYWVSSFVHDAACRDAVLSVIDHALREHRMPAPRTRIDARLERRPPLVPSWSGRKIP